MSTDAGYMLIRVDLQGAQQAAGEAKMLQGAIAGTGKSAAAASTASATGARNTKRYGNAWSAVGKAAKFAALGLGAVAVGIGAIGVKSVQAMKELGLVAAGLRRNLDLTAEAGSRWAAVASARGIAPTSLNMGFKTLAQNLTEASKGEDSYVENLRMIGIGHKDIEAGTKDFDSFLMTVADRFGEMEGSAKRQTAAAKLLGRGYQTILPLFADGSKGLEEYLGWADKYNVTMGDKMVDSTVRLAQAERESKVAWMGIQNVFAKEFLPTIIDVHDEFQEFAKAFTDPSLTHQQRMDLLVKKFQDVAEKIGQVLQTIIPVAVENMANNAPRVAVAFVKGFLNANAWGRLLVAAWVVTKFAPLMGAKGPFAKVGGSAGRWTVLGFITLGLITFGPMVYDWSKKMGEKFKDIGYDLGYKLGSEIVKVVNFVIDEIINRVPGVQLDQIELGAYRPPGSFKPSGAPTTETLGNIAGNTLGLDPGTTFETPPGGGGGGGGGGGKGGKGSGKRLGDLPAGKRVESQPGTRGKDYVEHHTHVHLDGKQVAEAVNRVALNKRARR